MVLLSLPIVDLQKLAVHFPTTVLNFLILLCCHDTYLCSLHADRKHGLWV